MKKKLFVLLSTLMIAVMMFCTASTAASAPAKPVELKLAHAWATTHHVHVILDQWTKDVEKATNGRVKITIYPGGALSTAVQLYDTVRTGVVDLAWFLQGYTPGKFPLTSVIELPFMASSSKQGSPALWEVYENSPEMQAEYGGVKVLSMWVVDPGQLMTSRKVVRNFDDVKGLKIRIGSDTTKATAEALGAVPILMAINELYDCTAKRRGGRNPARHIRHQDVQTSESPQGVDDRKLLCECPRLGYKQEFLGKNSSRGPEDHHGPRRPAPGEDNGLEIRFGRESGLR